MAITEGFHGRPSRARLRINSFGEYRKISYQVQFVFDIKIV